MTPEVIVSLAFGLPSLINASTALYLQWIARIHPRYTYRNTYPTYCGNSVRLLIVIRSGRRRGAGRSYRRTSLSRRMIGDQQYLALLQKLK